MLVRTLEDKFEEMEAAIRTRVLAEGELIGSIRTLQRVLGRPISTEQDLLGQDLNLLQNMLDDLNAALGEWASRS